MSLPLTLRAFQHALSELVASPASCLDVRAGRGEFFGRFDLSQSEKQRLREVVWQQGMSVSCSMYRSNRVTPIYTLLNFTCFLLGDKLKEELEGYWASSELIDLQYKEEIERFGQYLKRRIHDGAIKSQFVEEVLDFELAMNELQFVPRKRLLEQIRNTQSERGSDLFQLSPLVRIVRFRHEPFELLDLLRQGHMPVNEVPKGKFILLLDAAPERINMKQLDTKQGDILLRVQAEGTCREYSDNIAELVLEQLMIPKLTDARVSLAAI